MVRRASALVAIVMLWALCIRVEADEGAEFVKQVIDEDEGHANDYHSMDDKAYEQEMLRRQAAEEERLQRIREQEQAQMEQQNERIRRQREQQLQAEMNRLNDEQRKLFRKQQKRDAKMVNKILKAAAAENPYGVLGLPNNWQIKIVRGRSMSVLGKFTIHIPEIVVFEITASKIKRAYRNRAKAVHPDKSKDPRATEAFMAVENAASLLLNDQTRNQYDNHILSIRRQRRQKYQGAVTSAVHKAVGTASYVVGTCKAILGPFAFPVMIISVLIF